MICAFNLQIKKKGFGGHSTGGRTYDFKNYNFSKYGDVS